MERLEITPSKGAVTVKSEGAVTVKSEDSDYGGVDSAIPVQSDDEDFDYPEDRESEEVEVETDPNYEGIADGSDGRQYYVCSCMKTQFCYYDHY
jgi:hypothetical protein